MALVQLAIVARYVTRDDLSLSEYRLILINLTKQKNCLLSLSVQKMGDFNDNMTSAIF